MAYVKTNWTDRIVDKPLTFVLQDNGDGTTTLIPAEGTILSEGTPITSSNLNHLETQYDEALKVVQVQKVTEDTGIALNFGVNDPNTIDTTGWWQVTSTAPNMPVANYGWVIMHIKSSSTSAYQTAYQISTNNRVFYRRKSGTTWEAWREIARLDSPNFTAQVTAPSGAFTGAVSATSFYDNGTLLSSKYLIKSGDTMTGPLTVLGNSQGIALKAGGTADHVYLGFYADSQDQNTRSGFVGFGGAGSSTMNLENAMTGGNIRINTPSGRIYMGSGENFILADTDGSMGFFQSAGSYLKMYSGEHQHVFTGGYIISITNGQIKNQTAGGGNIVISSGGATTDYAVIRGQDAIYLQANSSVKVVAPLTTNSYKPILASAFTVNSYREDKDNIVESPSGALEKIKGVKVYDYHLDNELEEVERDEEGKVINRKPLDPSKVKKRKGLMMDEAPNDIKAVDGIDLYSMVSLLWQSVQELSTQIEELKKPTTPTPKAKKKVQSKEVN